MPLVKSSPLTLPPAEAALPAGVPLIGWHNLVTFSGITATSADPNYPASNMANEATVLEWRATTAAAQTIDITGLTGTIDYVGIARHNFAGRTVTIKRPAGTTLVAAYTPPDNSPLLFWFTGEALTGVKIEIGAGSAAARAAVVYAGKLLMAERGVDIGPDFLIPRFARKTETVSGRSARGDYLGSVVLSRYTAGMSVDFKHFKPDWYRANFDPFLLHAQSHHPFFWQWEPVGYPLETAFAWLNDDPAPVTNPITRRVSVSLKLDGIIDDD